jgi:hypothetical protein
MVEQPTRTRPQRRDIQVGARRVEVVAPRSEYLAQLALAEATASSTPGTPYLEPAEREGHIGVVVFVTIQESHWVFGASLSSLRPPAAIVRS